ncbi:MAG: hypothetical protein JXK05_12975 [Campylobacterales bacterium]|nr:hypothetical protein [Campylobacterales bacterium]
MKFTLIKDLRADPLMRSVMLGVLLFITLFIIADLLLKSHQIGLHVNQVALTLYGDEAQYLDPISPAVLLELIHADLFMSMLALLTLSALFIRLEPSQGRARIGVHLLFSSALLSPATLLGAHFGLSALVWAWVGLFWLWHLLALIMAASSAYRLLRS